MKPPEDSEATIQSRIVHALYAAEYTSVNKTHGNCFQPGWPDLYAFHRVYGHKWIEVKRPSGRFTKAQLKLFAEWDMAGIQIHVLCDADLTPLSAPGNWKDWR